MVWANALKQGFTTLNRNRKLIGIVLISVVFGKVINIVEQVTGRTLYEFIAFSINTDALKQIVESLQANNFDELQQAFRTLELYHLEHPQALILLGGLLTGATFIVFYNNTGLAAILRDLLIKHHYRSRQVIGYGKTYFLSFFRFKLPIYMLAGLVVVLISPLLFFIYQSLTPIPALTLIGLLIYPLFIVYKSFLSLGPKFIVVLDEHRIREVNRLTKALILANKGEIFLFFFVIAGLFFGSTIAAYFLMGSGLQFLISYSLSIFLLSYVTALLKVSSFIFFLSIRHHSHRSPTHEIEDS
jgi:hypothetical protein